MPDLTHWYAMYSGATITFLRISVCLIFFSGHKQILGSLLHAKEAIVPEGLKALLDWLSANPTCFVLSLSDGKLS